MFLLSMLLMATALPAAMFLVSIASAASLNSTRVRAPVASAMRTVRRAMVPPVTLSKQREGVLMWGRSTWRSRMVEVPGGMFFSRVGAGALVMMAASSVILVAVLRGVTLSTNSWGLEQECIPTERTGQQMVRGLGVLASKCT